jgi:hypothetical protein
MANEIEIIAMEPGVYGVQVTEGHLTTSHRIKVPEGTIESYIDGEVDEELRKRAVRESIEFLLERESATEILSQFSLDQIEQYFPEYPDELASRLAGA